MPVKVRLDRVVQLREREEEAARRRLGAARQNTARVRAKVEELRRRALMDGRQAGTAADWQAADAARSRALQAVKAAENELVAALAAEKAAQKAAEDAWRRAEALRRAADERRLELVREMAAAERKEFDALANLGTALRTQQRREDAGLEAAADVEEPLPPVEDALE